MPERLPSFISKPSVFTPFLRRFTNERERELRETMELYSRVTRMHRASKWHDPERATFDGVSKPAATVAGQIFLEGVEKYETTPLPLITPTLNCIHAIVDMERPIFDEANPNFESLTLQEGVDLRRFLRAQEYFLLNEERVISRLKETLTWIFAYWVSIAPVGEDDAALFHVPLYNVIPDLNTVLSELMVQFCDNDEAEIGLFAELSDKIVRNVCAANGVLPDNITRPLKLPIDFKLPPAEAVNMFVGGTPFWEFFNTPVPLQISAGTRFEHHWIVAGSGHGKTQTLQYLIAHDLDSVAKGEASAIVVDSQGDLINRIAGLKRFAPGGDLEGRLVLIDPTDIEWPIALSLFSMGTERLKDYGQLDREKLQNSIIELLSFVLGSLLSAEMTSKQSTLFSFLIRAMLVIPSATIFTLMEMLQPGGLENYDEHLAKLPHTARLFLRTEYKNDKQFSETKQQVLRRLWGILENETFERMFSHPKSKLDLFTEMNSGKVILINTAKDLLKQSGTEVFGRFFIAMIAQAAQERATLSEDKRLPCFCYIDEFGEYAGNADRFITTAFQQVRKYKVGLIVAHQMLGDLSPKTQEALATNTSIKFAGGVSHSDATKLAREMRTAPEFILDQPKLTWAAYIRNAMSSAVPLSFPYGFMEAMPRMSEAEERNVKMANRHKYAVHYTEIPRPGEAAEDKSTDEKAQDHDAYSARMSPARDRRGPTIDADYRDVTGKKPAPGQKGLNPPKDPEQTDED